MQTIEEKRAYKAKWAREKLAKNATYREKNRLRSEANNKRLRENKVYINPPDITGKRFGKLLVLGKCIFKNGTSKWKCICDCGKEVEVCRHYLKAGTTRSCGCLKKTINKTHGEAHRSKEYSCWGDIKSRCLDKNNSNYANYGGRGIKICDRWKYSYENFLADMGRAPSKKYSIEREQNNGHYEKSNCKWATSKEQSNNRRNTIRILYNGQTNSLKQWSEKFNIKYLRLYYLVIRKNISFKEAIQL